LTVLYNFSFDKEVKIDKSWTKLKEYRRKLIAISLTIKQSHPDEGLLFILTTALQRQDRYTAIIDGFLIQQTLSTKEKFKILKEKEAQMKKADGKGEKANAAWRQYKTVYCYPNHHSSKRNSSSSNTSITEVSFECYCCRSTEYYIADCKFQTANKNYTKNLRLKEEKRGTNSKSSRIIDRTKEKKHCLTGYIKSTKTFKRKKYRYTAANQSSDDSENDIGTESFSENNSEKKTKLNKIEKVMFTKEEISKSTPADWALDTGASLSMTDQLDLYRKGSLRSLCKVLI